MGRTSGNAAGASRLDPRPGRPIGSIRPARPYDTAGRSSRRPGVRDFDAFAADVRRELDPARPARVGHGRPRGPRRLAAPAAPRRRGRRGSPATSPPPLAATAHPTPSRGRRPTLDSLEDAPGDGLDLLRTLRDRRSRPPASTSSPTRPTIDVDFDPTDCSNEWPVVPVRRRSPTTSRRPSDDDEPADRWQDRLVFDFNVSETSPVVKGTWVTVGHVVSLIVDGWTWADILRTHPELTEDDIRVCLAYTVAQDDGEADA